MVEVKSAYKINEDLTIEDDGFRLDFSAEEVETLKKIAMDEGLTHEELIEKIMKQAEDKAIDEITQNVKNYQKNAT